MPTTTHSARLLRLAAALVFAITLGTWLATGAHPGWTRTSATEMHHDAVTGIDFPVEHDTFVAGVEVLAAGFGFAAALGLSSLLVGRARPNAPANR
jgi:hypothetical protein